CSRFVIGGSSADEITEPFIRQRFTPRRARLGEEAFHERQNQILWLESMRGVGAQRYHASAEGLRSLHLSNQTRLPDACGAPEQQRRAVAVAGARDRGPETTHHFLAANEHTRAGGIDC